MKLTAVTNRLPPKELRKSFERAVSSIGSTLTQLPNSFDKGQFVIPEVIISGKSWRCEYEYKYGPVHIIVKFVPPYEVNINNLDCTLKSYSVINIEDAYLEKRVAGLESCLNQLHPHFSDYGRNISPTRLEQWLNGTNRNIPYGSTMCLGIGWSEQLTMSLSTSPVSFIATLRLALNAYNPRDSYRGLPHETLTSKDNAAPKETCLHCGGLTSGRYHTSCGYSYSSNHNDILCERCFTIGPSGTITLYENGKEFNETTLTLLNRNYREVNVVKGGINDNNTSDSSESERTNSAPTLREIAESLRPSS